MVLGVLATIDLFDCREILPWMGDRPLGQEVVSGAALAVVVPVVLSVLWWEQWRAGVFIGVALALMLHVTVAIVIVYAVIATLDALGEAARNPAARRTQLVRAAKWGAAALGVTAILVAIGMWAC